MSISVKQGNTWKNCDPYVRHSDQWKKVTSGWVKQGGVWKLFYGTTYFGFVGANTPFLYSGYGVLGTAIVDTTTPEQFATGDGVRTQFQLPVYQLTSTPTIWRNDWQGNQLMYDTPRTNMLRWSEDWTQSAWSTGGSFFSEMVVGDHPYRPGNVCYFGPKNGQNSFSNSITQQTISSLGPAGTYFIYQDLKAVAGAENVNCVRFLPVTNDGGSGSVGGVLWLTGDGGVRADNFASGNSFSSHELGSYPLGNGWYRCWIRFTTTRAIGSFRATRAFPYRETASITGDGTAGLLGTMVQLQDGSTATSYIKTENSASTITDYTVNNNGLVTFSEAPLPGAILTWTGSGRVVTGGGIYDSL